MPETPTPTPTPETQDVLNSTVMNNTAALLASSDLSAIFYLHYSNGVIIPPLPFVNTSTVELPRAVVDRLQDLELEFHELDGLLQRALLWDAGYIYQPATSRRRRLTGSSSSSNSLDADRTDARTFPFLKVYTRNGVDMADIAPTRSEMETAGCALQLCSSEDQGTTWRAVTCTDSAAMLSTVHCAIDTGENQVDDAVAPDDRPRTVWTAFNSEDRDLIPNNSSIATPDVNVASSAWSAMTDQNFGSGSTSAEDKTRIFSIHTVPFTTEPAIGQCPATRVDEQGSLLPTLTIPCASYASLVGASNVGVGGTGRLLVPAANLSQWRQPTASKLVTTWLRTVAPKSATRTPTPGNKPPGSGNRPNPSSGGNERPPSNDAPSPSESNDGNSSGVDLATVVPIVVGVLVAVAVVFGFVIQRRRRSAKQTRRRHRSPYDRGSMMKTEDGYLDGTAYLSPAANTVAATYMSGLSTHDANLVFDMDDVIATGLSGSGEFPQKPIRKQSSSLDPESKRRRPSRGGSGGMPSLRRHTSEPASTGSVVSRPSLDTAHLKLLQTDPNLSASRMSFDKLVFEKVVARSHRYDVWLCQFEGEELAVKRLRHHPEEDDDDEKETRLVDAFVAEIQLTAALDHPNIARFVGVAWARLPVDSLCLVTEYAPYGDLRQYLATHGNALTWPQHKAKWALGVASAIEFLHAQQPPVLHLALHSRHVLLSHRLQPKLVDFGERPRADEWRRVKGELPYWAAPELRRGDGHHAAADVFAFGMLLAELDGAHELAHRTLDANSSCPAVVRELVARCTDAVAARRPTMREVLRALQLADFEA